MAEFEHYDRAAGGPVDLHLDAVEVPLERRLRHDRLSLADEVAPQGQGDPESFLRRTPSVRLQALLDGLKGPLRSAAGSSAGRSGGKKQADEQGTPHRQTRRSRHLRIS